MTAQAEVLKAQLSQLPEAERAELAAYLIDSLDEADDPGVDAAWEAELLRRVDQIRRGDVEGEDAETFFARLRRSDP